MRNRFWLATVSATALCASVAPALAQPVQGLYASVAGGMNLAQDQTVRLSPEFPGGRLRYGAGVAGIGAVGWGFGNGFRVEVEGNYRQDPIQHFLTPAFPSQAGGHQENYGAMANVLFDMDIGKSWLYPYFGAGAGYGWSHMDGYYLGNSNPGAVYASGGPFAPPGQIAQHFGGTTGNFAYQGIFGLSIPVPWVVGLSSTVEYRFYSILGPEGFSGTSVGTEGAYGPKPASIAKGNQDVTTNFEHTITIGLRYEFNPAPPPVAAPAPVPAAPPPAEARTYLVFFDWDRSELTPRAREIVTQAASSSTHVQTTRIEVDGYTDTSSIHGGSRGAQYNQALSVRRARSVQAELVRDGVPAAAIDIHGFGETHPLVATGPNQREPQNRRVEIVLH